MTKLNPDKKGVGRSSVFDQFTDDQLKEIDSKILEGSMTRQQIRLYVEKTYKKKIGNHHIRYRTNMIKKEVNRGLAIVNDLVKDIPDEDSKKSVVKNALLQGNNANSNIDKLEFALEKLQDKLISIGDRTYDSLDDTSKDKGLINKLKQEIKSVFRYTKELFDQVPYLAYMNYAINVMQIRIAKRFELELQLGVIMKDNTTDIQTMVDIIGKAVLLQQSLGLLDNYDKQTINNNLTQNNNTLILQEQQSKLNEYRNQYKQFENITPICPV